MPVTLNYPGVYIEEVPSGVRTITGVATSVTAFIGRTARGEPNAPLLVTSYADFERNFGMLDAAFPLSYAVRDFFLNGGAQAVIVRLFNGAGGVAARPEPGTLPLVAASPGAWGNRLAIKIDRDGIDAEVAQRFGLSAADLFNLTVVDGPPFGLREQFRNLSFREGARRIDRVLQAESRLVRFNGTPAPDAAIPDATEPAADPTNPQATTVALFTGGADGNALVANSYTQSETAKTGMFALEKADLFNLLCIPPDTRGGDTPVAVYQAALAYCVRRRAMLIVDPPAAWGTPALPSKAELDALGLAGPDARNAAVFFPRVRQADPALGGQLDTFAPSGIVAGVFARTDTQRGVWKAPAGLDATLSGVQGLAINLTDGDNGQLNPLGINCLRAFPGAGRVLWGARTLRGADQLADEYKYIPVRRLALYIEESLYRGTQWVVFEPNDEPLWAQIRLNVGAFMQNLFRQGAFQGSTPREAYFVKCDRETTTQADINLGIVNILVGFAPLKPAEFVVIRLQQMAGALAA